MAAIDLEEAESGYVLTQTDSAGSIIWMVLNESEVLGLAQSAEAIRQAVVARRTRAGATAVVVTPVDRLKVEVDIHRSALHMTLQTPGGTQTAFLLEETGALVLREQLDAGLKQVASNRPARH